MAAEDTLDADKLASKSVRPRYDGKHASFATFEIRAKAWMKKNNMFHQVVNNNLPPDDEEHNEPSNAGHGDASGHPGNTKYWVRDNGGLIPPYQMTASEIVTAVHKGGLDPGQHLAVSCDEK